ncbi:uncharacterized protein LOC141603146 [Silene latifolia]|uniref:uncharacterized protein LOC141603146 n=1 Tax=Silene latifolia TaxID=37657 RepID=UPI003D76DC77
MNKRKLPDSSSDSSVVYNTESHHNFTPNSSFQSVQNPNFKKHKTSLEMNFLPSTNDLGAGILVQLFSVQLNGAPFFDFFAQQDAINSGIQGTTLVQVDDVSTDLPVSYSDCGGPTNSGESSECSEGTVIEAVPLRMYRPEADINWTIRKVLTASDCNAQHRLLIRKGLNEAHIIPHLDESSRFLIDSPDGLRVTVFDVDKIIELKLTLKKWPSSQCYGLMNNWKRDFVSRRGLLPGDEVGICWDNSNHRLLFSVLNKSTLQHHES